MATMVRVRGGPKGVRHISMEAWRLERDQARGKRMKKDSPRKKKMVAKQRRRKLQ